MCTILLRLDPLADEAVLLAANRDEFRDRPADEPGRIAPGIFAGRDLRGGGTWLAIGAGGLAAVTNIRDLPRRTDAPSRGLLPLAALDGALPGDFAPWNAFNLLVIDGSGARVFTHLGDGRLLGPVALGPGSHAIVNDPFGTPSLRWRRAQALADRDSPSFDALGDHGPPPHAGLCHHGDAYGTVSATALALDRAFRPVRYLHRSGPPCTASTRDLTASARETVGAAPGRTRAGPV
jgi:hypothetical protein